MISFDRFAILLKRISFVLQPLLVLGQVWMQPLSAQPQDMSQLRKLDTGILENAIVVGMLKGRDDYRFLKVRLTTGEYEIGNSANSKRIELLFRSSEWAAVRLESLFNGHNSSVRKVVYRYFDSDLQLLAAMILDKVDYAYLHDRELVTSIRRDTTNIYMLPLRVPENTVDMIVYNLTHPVLRDKNVRRAISYAIDRDEILSEILSEQGVLAKGSPFEDDSPVYPRNIALDHYKYDPKRAIELLTSTGWRRNRQNVFTRNGRKLSFTLAFERGVRLEEKIARKIKHDLNRRSIEVKLLALEKHEMRQQFESGKYEAALVRHHFEENIDALYNFFADPMHSFIRFTDETFELTYKRAKNGSDQRNKIARMQALLNQKSVATFLMFRWYVYHLINRKKVANFYNGEQGTIKPFNEWHLINLK